MVSLIYKSDFNHHTKSKHIRVCSDFRKEQVGNKVTVFCHIPIELQQVDIFTMPPIGERFTYSLDCLVGRRPTSVQNRGVR